VFELLAAVLVVAAFALALGRPLKFVARVWPVVWLAAIGATRTGQGWRARTPSGAGPGRGVALYYPVLFFNLAVTAWIGEWAWLAAGVAVHVALVAAVLARRRRRWLAGGALGVHEVQRA
jgi:hypothetical protein